MASYSSLSKKQAEEILAHYGRSVKTIEALEGGMANSSYLIDNELVLTVLDNHSMHSAERLATIMAHVQNAGIETPQALPDNLGNPVRLWNGKPIILKPYVSVTQVSRSELNRASDLGALLNKIHAISAPSWLTRHGRRIPLDALDQLNDQRCDDLKRAIHLVAQSEHMRLFESYPEGFCHGDLMGDNVLEDECAKLIPIDWETASVDCIALDLGISCVSAIKRELPLDEFQNNIVVGYNQASSIIFNLNDIDFFTDYARVLMSYHRYIRHNITHPSFCNRDIYKDLIIGMV